MLNKEICKRCRRESGGRLKDWDGYAEHAWGLWMGYVECPNVGLFLSLRFAKVGQPPPVWCPYAVEHVVSQDAE